MKSSDVNQSKKYLSRQKNQNRTFPWKRYDIEWCYRHESGHFTSTLWMLHLNVMNLWACCVTDSTHSFVTFKFSEYVSEAQTLMEPKSLDDRWGTVTIQQPRLSRKQMLLSLPLFKWLECITGHRKAAIRSPADAQRHFFRIWNWQTFAYRMSSFQSSTCIKLMQWHSYSRLELFTYWGYHLIYGYSDQEVMRQQSSLRAQKHLMRM